MSRFSKEQLTEAFRKLPEAVRKAVISTDRSDLFVEIMNRQGLTVEQIGIVADELAPVTVGLVLPQQFPANLRAGLPGLPQEKIDAVVRDVDTLLLQHIRANVLQTAHTGNTPAPQPTPTPVPPAQQSMPTATTPREQAETLQKSAPQAPQQTITDARLSGTFRLPPDTVVVKTENPVTTPSAPVIPKKITENGTYIAGQDPYKEPIA